MLLSTNTYDNLDQSEDDGLVNRGVLGVDQDALAPPFTNMPKVCTPLSNVHQCDGVAPCS